MSPVADTRSCEQCGGVFTPRREHARFCSPRCRVAWNRENARNRAAELQALDWSITAMCDATGRFLRVTARDRPRAFAVISEAVWWVTIVDGTLVRYHPDSYDRVLAAHHAAERRRIEGTLGGLRFVRNRMGQYLDPVDFIQPAEGAAGPGDGRVTAWTWRSVPEPTLTSLPPRGQAWEMTRYRAYQAQVAGRTVEEIFGLAAAFLRLAAAEVTAAADVGADAAR
jgi:predicted nucleic acid-binding Zn ribbon protein